MVSRRARKMHQHAGPAGWLDSLRYNEASRQGIGLLLLPLCAWFVVSGAPARIVPGLLLALAGEGWRIYAAGFIHKNRQLATTGAYSLVRHPLYLGNFLILGGFTLAGAHWGVLILVIVFVLFYYPAAIRYEDAKLERLFGEDWRQWYQETPAVFPASLRWRANADAEWNARQSLLRNGELPISIYLMVCAALLLHRAGWY